MVCGPGERLYRSGSGAPLTSSTGMSVREPEREAGLLCPPLPCRCSCLVGRGLSRLCLLSKGLVLETSLQEPDMPAKMASGESSSLARDRLLSRMEEERFVDGVERWYLQIHTLVCFGWHQFSQPLSCIRATSVLFLGF